MKEYNVHEVLSILDKYYITESQQMVTRWIREGKIRGIRSENRKEGFRVLEEDLFEFIEEQRPGLPAVFEVYEEYVTKLNPKRTKSNKDFLEEGQKNISDIQEDIELEAKQLKERLENLENTVTDLYEDKRVIEMQLIEVSEQNENLMNENEMLKELFEILDEENKKLKETVRGGPTPAEKSDREEKKNINVKTKAIPSLSFDKFKELSSDVTKALQYNKSDLENYLHEIYNHIYTDEGLVKDELLLKSGHVKCPYTTKTYKQQKRLVTTAVTCYFENLNQKENELIMANDSDN